MKCGNIEMRKYMESTKQKNITTRNNKKQNKLKKYEKQKELDITAVLQQNLFKSGYEKQIMYSITANENWIKLVKMVFASTKK